MERGGCRPLVTRVVACLQLTRTVGGVGVEEYAAGWSPDIPRHTGACGATYQLRALKALPLGGVFNAFGK